MLLSPLTPVDAYLRKSRALKDPDDPLLLDHHQSALARLAAREGLTVPPEAFVREIGSAETIAGRPRFAALLATWEALPRDRGGVVLVTELERLSRGSMQERGRIADALARADLWVFTLARRYDLRNADDLLMAQIQWIFAEHELGKYKQRKALKLEELLRRGRSPNGRPPFGYVWDDAALDFRPEPQEFLVLRQWCEEIFTLSLDKIGSKWGIGRWVVYQSLTNPVICGWPARRTGYREGQEPQGRPSRLPREQWRWPAKRGAYEPACSRERWEQIQTLLKERAWRRARTGNDAEGWCRDVLRFVAAPALVPHLASDSNYRTRPDDPRRWTYEVTVPGQPRLSIPRAAVHAAAEAALRDVFRRPNLQEAAAAAGPAAPAGPAPDPVLLDTERQRAARALVELLRREIAEASPIQQAALASLRVETEAEIRRLDALIELESRRRPDPSPGLGELLPILTALGQPERWWSGIEGSFKRRLAAAFLHRVWADVRRGPGQLTLERSVVAVELPWWLADPNGE